MTCSIDGESQRALFMRKWHSSLRSRWHGDPATTRPIQTRSSGGGGSAAQGGDDQDDDDPSMDYGGGSDPHTMIISNGMNGIAQHDRTPQQPPPPPPPLAHQVSYINPQSLGRDPSQMPPTPQTATGGQVPMVSTPSMQHTHTPPGAHSNPPPQNNAHHPPPPPPPPQSHPPHAQPSAPPGAGMSMPPGDPSAPALLPLPFSPQAMNMLMQYLQSQTTMNKMKMEYLRKREGREEEEHRTRLEASRLQLEKDKLELEEKRKNISMKQKSEKAVVCLLVCCVRCAVWLKLVSRNCSLALRLTSPSRRLLQRICGKYLTSEPDHCDTNGHHCFLVDLDTLHTFPSCSPSLFISD